MSHMSDSIPIAYLLTLRTYGTWPHRDPRGLQDLDPVRDCTLEGSPGSQKSESGP
jgi:hypothetical protein